jgi:hypothetical protein
MCTEEPNKKAGVYIFDFTPPPPTGAYKKEVFNIQ